MSRLVKTPEKNINFLDDSDKKYQGIDRLMFQSISGAELSTITRQNTVEGLNPYYKIISNLSRLNNEFDPISIIAKQKRGQSVFDIYVINLLERIPDSQYIEDNEIPNYYYIDANGDLVIHFVNMGRGEFVELEIVTNAIIYNIID